MVEPGGGLCDSLRGKLPGVGGSWCACDFVGGVDGWGFRAGAVPVAWALSARPH